jgi:signal transduction histidine kinase/CheY-like chemotaxis protein
MTSLVRQLARWLWGAGNQARSLSSVLPIIATLIMAALAIVLGTIMAKTTREATQNERGNTLASEAKTFGGLLDQSIGSELADLVSRASSLTALGLHREPSKLSIWIDGIQQKIPEYTWVGFADQNGTIRAASGGMLEGRSVAEREWFQRGLLSPVTIDLHDAKLLEPLLPVRSDGPWRFIDLAVPLHDRNGDTLGVIGAHLSWDWLMAVQKNFAATLPLPRHAEVFVVGTDGKIRLAGLSEENRPLNGLISFQRAVTGELGWVRETWPDGNDYIVGFAANPAVPNSQKLDWITLIRVPVQGFDSAADYAIYGIWVLITATIALFYIGTQVTLRVALMPVRQLVSQVSEVAQHGGRVDLSMPTPREFRALGQATNQMILAIEASQSSDLAKSRFIANMSHEVRTLLHGMLSYAELIRMGKDPAQTQQDLAKLRDYGQELIPLLNDLLDLSAIEEDKLRIEPRAVGLAALVHSNVRLYTGMAASKGLDLIVDIRVLESLHVVTDPLRLGQILRNLIANAVKFTLRGSVIITVELRDEEKQQILSIHVRDTGIGLTQPQQEMVFGRFEQADPSVHEQFDGSGLGLFLARSLVQAMGGTMTLNSEPNYGSEFGVTLPIQSSAADISSAQQHAVRDGQTRLTVMCVDDLEDNRKVLCRWLALHGHTSVQATTGKDAIEKAAKQSFDLILMDIDLPDMQGTEAIHAIRCSSGGSANATIYTVSGHAYGTDVRRSLAAGSDGHIAKPVDYALLRDKISLLQKTR